VCGAAGQISLNVFAGLQVRRLAAPLGLVQGTLLWLLYWAPGCLPLKGL